MAGRVLRKSRPEKRRENSPAPVVDENSSDDDDGDDVYEVEKILAKRTRNGRVEYFLKWKNFSEKHATWEPIKNIHDKQMIADYEKSKKEKNPAARRGGRTSTPTKKSDSDDEKSSPSRKSAEISPKKSKKTDADDVGTIFDLSDDAEVAETIEKLKETSKKMDGDENSDNESVKSGSPEKKEKHRRKHTDDAELAERDEKRKKMSKKSEDEENSDYNDVKSDEGAKKKEKSRQKRVGKDSASADFIVERIVDVRRGKNGKKEYLVKWKNYSTAENTWELVKNLTCKKSIDEFEARHRPSLVEEDEAFGKDQLVPVRLTGCTKKSGDIFLLAEIEGRKMGCWIRLETARRICPQLVIDFMMHRVDWVEEYEI